LKNFDIYLRDPAEFARQNQLFRRSLRPSAVHSSQPSGD